MRRADKFALFLVMTLGAFFLAVAILGAFGGALDAPGISMLIQIWLRLSLILILPLWLLLRGIGAIFSSSKDTRFNERHSHW